MPNLTPEEIAIVEVELLREVNAELLAALDRLTGLISEGFPTDDIAVQAALSEARGAIEKGLRYTSKGAKS